METITVCILTEDHSEGRSQRKITGLTIDPAIAESMLEDSFFGEIEERKITQERWDAIQRLLEEAE